MYDNIHKIFSKKVCWEWLNLFSKMKTIHSLMHKWCTVGSGISLWFLLPRRFLITKGWSSLEPPFWVPHCSPITRPALGCQFVGVEAFHWWHGEQPEFCLIWMLRSMLWSYRLVWTCYTPTIFAVMLILGWISVAPVPMRKVFKASFSFFFSPYL